MSVVNEKGKKKEKGLAKKERRTYQGRKQA
jgi:hypothetical protein